jgi:hypothetical protein
VDVEGIRGAQEDALNADMHESANTAIPSMTLLTDRGKAKSKIQKPKPSKTPGNALHSMKLY